MTQKKSYNATLNHKNWENQFKRSRQMPIKVKPWKDDPDSYHCVLSYAYYLELGGEHLPPGTWGVEIRGKEIIPLGPEDYKDEEATADAP